MLLSPVSCQNCLNIISVNDIDISVKLFQGRKSATPVAAGAPFPATKATTSKRQQRSVSLFTCRRRRRHDASDMKLFELSVTPNYWCWELDQTKTLEDVMETGEPTWHISHNWEDVLGGRKTLEPWDWRLFCSLSWQEHATLGWDTILMFRS